MARNVQNLGWYWYSRAELEDKVVTRMIDQKNISQVLSHVQDSLIEPSISDGANTHYEPTFSPLDVTRLFEAFRHLHRLEKIEVPLPFLAGFTSADLAEAGMADALPRNIQWVTITDDLCREKEYEWMGVEVLEYLAQWFHERAKYTPNIRGFALLLRIKNYGAWEAEARGALMDLGLRGNVEISIIKFAYNTRWYLPVTSTMITL